MEQLWLQRETLILPVGQNQLGSWAHKLGVREIWQECWV